jgi:hypothetical protein
MARGTKIEEVFSNVVYVYGLRLTHHVSVNVWSKFIYTLGTCEYGSTTNHVNVNDGMHKC